MRRLTRETTLMDTAYAWARRSTCDRLHVGAVFHREGRILVQAYNGAPSGLGHCDHSCDCDRQRVGKSLEDTHELECNSRRPCTRAVHAEQGGIAYAARLGVGLEGAEVSVTHQPCLPCAQSLINAGIEKVWFCEPYRLNDGLSLLHEAGIRIERIVDYVSPF